MEDITCVRLLGTFMLHRHTHCKLQPVKWGQPLPLLKSGTKPQYKDSHRSLSFWMNTECNIKVEIFAEAHNVPMSNLKGEKMESDSGSGSLI